MVVVFRGVTSVCPGQDMVSVSRVPGGAEAGTTRGVILTGKVGRASGGVVTREETRDTTTENRPRDRDRSIETGRRSALEVPLLDQPRRVD